MDETFFRHCACVEGEESNVERPADNLTPFILVAGVLANKETWTLIKPKLFLFETFYASRGAAKP